MHMIRVHIHNSLNWPCHRSNLKILYHALLGTPIFVVVLFSASIPFSVTNSASDYSLLAMKPDQCIYILRIIAYLIMLSTNFSAQR